MGRQQHGVVDIWDGEKNEKEKNRCSGFLDTVFSAFMNGGGWKEDWSWGKEAKLYYDTRLGGSEESEWW